MKRLILPLLLCALLCACAVSAAPAETTGPQQPLLTLPPVQAAPAAQPAAAQPIQSAPPEAPAAQSAEAEAPMTAAQQSFYDGLRRDAEPILTFDAVMNGNLKFLDTASGQSTSLKNQLSYWSATGAAQVTRLTLADLDADGAVELILEVGLNLDTSLGFQLLRYDSGSAVGYILPELDSLSLNGSYLSGGEAVRLRFSGAQYSTVSARQDEDAYWFSSWDSFLYPGARKASDVIRGVLEGSHYITDTQSGNAYPITQAGQILVPADVPAYVEQYALVDMDGNGEKELILAISNYQGFIIVNQSDGMVYGSAAWYRAFQDLKTDGTYLGTGSASDHGYYQRTFDGQHWTETVLAETYLSSATPEQTTQVYKIAGQLTTAEAFAKFEQTQAAKPSAAWYTSWEACLANG